MVNIWDMIKKMKYNIGSAGCGAVLFGHVLFVIVIIHIAVLARNPASKKCDYRLCKDGIL